MNFFSAKSKKQINLVLDISSGSVGGVLVLIEEGMLPLILSTHRKNFSLNLNFDSDILEKKMLEAVEAVCSSIQKSCSYIPEKIFCIIGTPWSHGQVREIVYENDKNFTFNTKLANSLIEKELNNLKNEWTGLTDVIDKKTTAVFLNGYLTENPMNLKARHLKMDVYFSLANKEIISKIEEKIHKTFKKKIGVTSQMFSDYIIVRDAFELKNDFVVINFGEEVTEVSIMKHDHLVGTAFFPFGKNTIVRLIANGLGKSLYEAKSIFDLYSNGFIDVARSEKILKYIKISETEWQRELHNILINLLPNRVIPSNIFIIADDKSLSFFEQKIKKSFFPEFTTSQEDFSVIIASNKLLHGFADFAHDAQKDSALTMKSIFINHI